MIAWPHAAAVGAAIGAAAVAWGGAAAVGLLAATTALAALLVFALPAARLTLLALALAAPLVAWRAAADARAPDPWADAALRDVVVIADVADGVAWPRDGAPGLLLRGVVPDGRAELRGRVVALPGRRNPGGFDARAHWWRRNVTAALEVDAATPLAAPGWRLRARAALHAGVVAGLDERPAALAQALTLGLRDDLGSARDLFAASGLAHLLSLSGLHVGILAAALTLAVRGIGRVRSSAVVLVLIAYVAIVGPSPAIVRAAIMVGVALLGRAFGVGGAGWGAHLSLALVVSLLARPRWATDLGFALSYLSVIGMGLAAAPLTARFAAWRVPWPLRPTAAVRVRPGRGERARSALLGYVRASLAVGVSAQWATTSLVASQFGALPLFAPLANLLAVPLTTLLVPLGFLAGVLGLVHPVAAVLLNYLTAPLARALLATAEAAARLPSLPWGEVGALGHAAFAIASLALLAGLHRLWPPWRVSTTLLAAALATTLPPPRHAVPELIALDVGQGDAVLIRLPRAQAILIDGGGTPFGSFDVGARIVVPALRALGVAALPLVIATHPDTDHVEGLAAVLRAFPVGTLLVGHPGDNPAWLDLMRVARARGVPVVAVRRGETLRVGDLTLDVVHPTHALPRDGNDGSVGVVVRWRGAAWAVLLGDVPAATEAMLPLPHAPVLLAPHHGSGTSTSTSLLRAVAPAHVWISVGENRYGHPSPAVVARVAAAGARVATTRAEGALRTGFPPPPLPP